MWFGTEDGLNKYDGYKFTVYKHDPDDSTSISHNYARYLYEDKSGVLWIGTWGGGLNKFNSEKEQFISYQPEPDNPNSFSDRVAHKICEDQYGILWISTATTMAGVNKFDPKSEHFTHYSYEPNNLSSLSSNLVHALCLDKLGVLWLGTWFGGLNKYDREKNQFIRYQHNPDDPHSLSVNNINVIYEDKSGELWIGTENGGLNKFDREKEQFIHFKHEPDNPNSPSHNTVMSIHEDKLGLLWFATFGGGLNSFDHKKHKFTRYLHDDSDSYSLSSNLATSVYQDKTGVLWVATWGGLNKFDPQKTRFLHYRHYPGKPNSLSKNAVWSIYESKHDGRTILWIGTWEGGLNKIDRETGQYRHYLNDSDNPNSLSDNSVLTILESNMGEGNILWIGTNLGLHKFDIKKGKFTRYIYDPNQPFTIAVRSLCEDRYGMLWIGTRNGGLKKLNPATGQIIQMDIRYETMTIYEDRSGIMWVGVSEGGFYRYNRESDDFSRFIHDPLNPYSISHNSVLSVYETHHKGKDILWVGTGGGLNKFDRETEQFIHYTEKDGLPNDVINGILEDMQGNLWLSTNNGLSKFDPETTSFRNYDVNDGLQSNQFNHGAYCRNTNGEMFFGGTNGFNAFHPDSIKDNPYIPNIVITDFQIFNESVVINNIDVPESKNEYSLPKHISTLEEIELTYKENAFSFEFAALDYRSPQKNRYAYMMEGFENDWNYTNSKRRFVTYTNLDPGSYVFKVKGTNNDQIWNEEGTSIKIIITPPWWKTTWAYSAYVLLFFLTLYSLRKYDMKRQRLKHDLELEHIHAEKLEELNRIKSRFFANISHEFRTPLTLITGPVKQMLLGEFRGNLKEQYRMILRNGHRLLRLVNQLLDFSRLESGGMKLQVALINVIKYIKGLVLSFSSLAERNKITLKFDSEVESIMGYFDRDKLEKIISNLLSNAFKFTPKQGKIEVRIRVHKAFSDKINNTFLTDHNVSLQQSPFKILNSDFVNITISNTGPGIPQDQMNKIFDRFYQVDDSVTRRQEGSGIGLALTKELVEIHHGKIDLQCSRTGQSTLTTFTVSLPLTKDHFKPEEIIQESILENTKELKAEEIDKVIVEREESGETLLTQKKSAPTLLIVEDNPDVTSYIRSFMEKDYRIVDASNGEVGFKKAIDKVPDLIISDVMMPEKDGFELCQKLKSDQRTSHIPVILLTAKADMDSKIEGLEYGADDYIAKPFEDKELQIRSNNLIEQRRQLRDHFRKELVFNPAKITVNSIDEQFLDKVNKHIEQHMDDMEYTVEKLSYDIGMSRQHLNRKLHSLTDHSARDFIRSMRLRRAAQLLQKRNDMITQIAYQVGFNNLSYFTKCFRKQFGQSPSQYTARYS
jgi:signal transduction histidine kinase/ligand-binding sensor domain-containing protein/DNA-binding response OmpR family regulator